MREHELLGQREVEVAVACRAAARRSSSEITTATVFAIGAIAAIAKRRLA